MIMKTPPAPPRQRTPEELREQAKECTRHGLPTIAAALLKLADAKGQPFRLHPLNNRLNTQQ